MNRIDQPSNGTELSRSAERGSEATERSAVGWSEMLARPISLSLQQFGEVVCKYLCQLDRNGIAYLSRDLFIAAVKSVRIRECLQTGCLSGSYCTIGCGMSKSSFGKIGTSGSQGIRRSVEIHSPVNIMISDISTVSMTD